MRVNVLGKIRYNNITRKINGRTKVKLFEVHAHCRFDVRIKQAFLNCTREQQAGFS